MRKEPLDGGFVRTAKEWEKYLRGSSWRLPSVPLQIACLSELMNAREGPDAEVIEDIREEFERRFLTDSVPSSSGSRVFYSSTGLDLVIHESGTLDMYVIHSRISGTSDWIDSGRVSGRVMRALTGTVDTAVLDGIAEWFGRKGTYLYRCSTVKNGEDEGWDGLALQFWRSDRLDIDACKDTSGIDQAYGFKLEKVLPKSVRGGRR
jgi:hypothetical protein